MRHYYFCLLMLVGFLLSCTDNDADDILPCGIPEVIDNIEATFSGVPINMEIRAIRSKENAIILTNHKDQLFYHLNLVTKKFESLTEFPNNSFSWELFNNRIYSLSYENGKVVFKSFDLTTKKMEHVAFFENVPITFVHKLDIVQDKMCVLNKTINKGSILYQINAQHQLSSVLEIKDIDIQNYSIFIKDNKPHIVILGNCLLSTCNLYNYSFESAIPIKSTTLAIGEDFMVGGHINDVVISNNNGGINIKSVYDAATHELLYAIKGSLRPFNSQTYLSDNSNIIDRKTGENILPSFNLSSRNMLYLSDDNYLLTVFDKSVEITNTATMCAEKLIKVGNYAINFDAVNNLILETFKLDGKIKIYKWK